MDTLEGKNAVRLITDFDVLTQSVQSRLSLKAGLLKHLDKMFLPDRGHTGNTRLDNTDFFSGNVFQASPQIG